VTGKAGPGRIARRARVRGRVQGVWYRASTAQQAQSLGVHGHARNLDDGSVEVLAVGTAPAVDALLAWLSEGPPLAKVTGVEVEELDPASPESCVQGFRTG
jgi:acylphosphatase